jgi:SAM-dependent methyltransferase
MQKQIVDRLIGDYTEWKGWSPGGGLTFQHSAYSEEIARAELPSDAHFLEIGFGEGMFLDWAREQGFSCIGLEINSELVESARARGHDVYQETLGEVFPSEESLFDAVILFDVLEHINLDDIFSLLEDLQRLLKPGGKIIARFPNGASPFGRAYQYGDATHVSVLSGSLMAQVGIAAGFDLIGQYNAARGKKSRYGGIRNSWLARRIAFTLRDIIQVVIGLAYYGKNIPLDPDVTVILENKKIVNPLSNGNPLDGCDK